MTEVLGDWTTKLCGWSQISLCSSLYQVVSRNQELVVESDHCVDRTMILFF